MKSKDTLQTATFGAGCFWGIEETYRQTPGVVATSVGYMGGHTDHPTYEEVCADDTGHAEVVQVTFDPAQIRYEQLLGIFWENHNPTTRNRDGPNVGSQYRSVVFYASPEQRRQAEKSKAALAASGRWGSREIVTAIEPAGTFYRAEEYHQQFLAKRGKTSCHF